MKRRIFLFILLLPLFVIAARAQKDDFEIGKPTELKALKKVYVDTGTDLQNRDRIIKEISKANLGLEFVDKKDDAQILILFQGEKERMTAGTSRRVVTVQSGKFLVFVVTPDKPHLVMSYENTQESEWEQKPTTKFAKEFVKKYKEANK